MPSLVWQQVYHFGKRPFQPFNTGNQVSASIFAGEVVATAGLIFVIGTLVNNKQAHLVWVAVTSWVLRSFGTFTVTSALANPAVSFGWMFNGISTGSISTIIIAQLVGLVVAILILMVTGASTAKKTTPAKKAAPAFVPAPIVSAPAAAASKTVAKPAAKKPAAKKPVAKKGSS